MTEDEKKLMVLITKQLSQACETNLPRLCAFCKSEEGFESAANTVFTYCKRNGVSVQTAMAHIDSELS